MTIEIREHRIVGCEYLEAADHGGQFAAGEPQFIILHYTAGASFSGAARTLTADDDNFVSSHVLVGLDGRLGQAVPFDVVAWHAGKSAWAGLTGLNDHAIGIEMVNPGYARDEISYSGPTIRARHKAGGPERDWYLYPTAQIDRVVELCAALCRAYPSITAIVGHDDVSLSGKIDPGPAWDWSRFRVELDKRLAPRRGITDDQLQHWFTYHPPAPDQVARYAELRSAALDFARVVVACSPAGADQTAAVRKIREAVMTANAAIACES